jgi:hypothetical protein
VLEGSISRQHLYDLEIPAHDHRDAVRQAVPLVWSGQKYVQTILDEFLRQWDNIDVRSTEELTNVIPGAHPQFCPSTRVVCEELRDD